MIPPILPHSAVFTALLTVQLLRCPDSSLFLFMSPSLFSQVISLQSQSDRWPPPSGIDYLNPSMENSEPSLDEMLLKKHRSHVCRGHNAEEKGSVPSVHPHLHLKSAFIAALRVCQSQRGFVHCHITWLNRSWHWHLPLEVGYLAEEERWGKSLMNSSHGVPLS